MGRSARPTFVGVCQPAAPDLLPILGAMGYDGDTGGGTAGWPRPVSGLTAPYPAARPSSGVCGGLSFRGGGFMFPGVYRVGWNNVRRQRRMTRSLARTGHLCRLPAVQKGWS
jgi:hypothetical protein